MKKKKLVLKNPEKELIKQWNKIAKGKTPISDYVPAYLYRDAFVKGYNFCYNQIKNEI